MPILIDIVLPCYNPNDKWHLELLKFKDFIKSLYSINYIIVNDGSDSNTILKQIEVLKQNNTSLQFISYRVNKGKGFALRKGVEAATAEYIVYTDIDFPFSNESTLEIINALTQNNGDVVAGVRSAQYYRNKMSFFRRTLSKSFRIFLKYILRMNVTDTQCGLKGFNKKGRAEFLKTTINRYLFDFEFIYHCTKNRNIQLLTVQAELKDNVIFSSMRIKILLQETFNLIAVLFFKTKKS